VKPD
jgi:ATP-dependent DNA helicase 2 subunit 2